MSEQQNICNICGANYEYKNGHWMCPACGAYKPEEITNEEQTLLYSAEQKLRLSEFDDAEWEFDDIIRKYPTNHAGYWGRLRARYGIKYEEDFDGRRIPTCCATSIESFLSDSDYKKAIELADRRTTEYYREQAEYIERVRKEWVEKARKEKPYDVFICYKDSDLGNGVQRTRDSIAAQELYIHLQNQGYRVFYSRETLRNKVGEKYEPYIFNAISTAKVMIVFGSSAEYVQSTWVKNEWVRFSKKIAAGEKKENSLVVAYAGFDPKYLPKALSSMQCMDATKPSFYSDLEKHIDKVIHGEKKKRKLREENPELEGDKNEGKSKRKKAIILSATSVILVISILLGVFVGLNRNTDDPPLPDDDSAAISTEEVGSDVQTEVPGDGSEPEETTAPSIEEIPKPDVSELKGDGFDITITSSKNNLSADAVVTVKELLSSDKAYQVATEAFNKWGPGFAIYDINVSEFDGTGFVEVKLPLPKGMDTSLVSVYYIDETTSAVSKMQTSVKNGYVTFMTNHFSPYAIVEKWSGGFIYADGVVYGCDSTDAQLIIPESIKQGEKVIEIAEGAFEGKQYIKEIVLPEGLDHIDKNAFKNCINVESIIIPSTLIEIGSNAFDACRKIEKIYFEGNEAQWKSIKKGSSNEELNAENVYYYLETRPFFSYNNWHYKDGKATVWIPAIEGTDEEDAGSTSGGSTSGGSTNGGSIGGGSIGGGSIGGGSTSGGSIGGGSIGGGSVPVTPPSTPVTPPSTPVTPPVTTTYSITFNSNGGVGTMSSQSAASGATITLTTNTFTRTGYTFKGWSTSSGGTVKYTDKQGLTVSASMTLYAVWEANTNTIVFKANGGSGTMQSQTGKTGAYITLNANTFTREGYIFKGWSKTSGGSVAYSDKANYYVSTAETQTLYAVWQSNTYTIVFNANGGSGTMSNQTATVGESTTLNANTFTRDGYIFMGWATSSSGSVSYSDKASFNSSYNTTRTLYAVWKKSEIYTITFVTNGGEALEPLTAEQGTTIELPVAVRDGYTFDCWAEIKEYDYDYLEIEEYNSTKMPSQNLTIYALWKEETFLSLAGSYYNGYFYLNSDKESYTYVSNSRYHYGSEEDVTVMPSFFKGLPVTGVSFSIDVEYDIFIIQEGVESVAWSTDDYDDMSSIREIYLPTSIKTLSDLPGEDYHDHLMHIYYSGTTAQWNQIRKTSDWTTDASLYTVTCLGDYTTGLSFTLVDGDSPYYKVSGYTGSSATVNIPAFYNGLPVKEIGDNAFKDKTVVTEVYMPYGIKTIGANAFANTSISSIYLHLSISTIGDGAFAGCKSLSQIELPRAVNSIGKGAFAGCTALTTVNIKADIMTISESMFEGCTKLNNIKMPSTITHIGAKAFNGCTALSMTIPDSVESIGDGAFGGYMKDRIYIPSSVKIMGAAVFSGCDDLVICVLHDHRPAGWNDNWCGSEATVYWEDEIHTNGLVFQKLGNSYGVADYNGTDTEVVLPKIYKGLPVTEIAESAFEGLSISSVEIPSSINVIREYAFCLCGNIKITFKGTEAQWNAIVKEEDWALSTNYKLEYTPDDELIYNTVNGDGVVKSIGSCTDERIVISATNPEGKKLVTIGEGAFKDSLSLKKLIIYNNIKTIEKDAFSGCSNLKTIIFCGTKSEWDAISKPEGWNSALEGLEISYLAEEGTLYFDANGGDGEMTSQTVALNQKITLPENTFKRFGYVFSGWATSPNGAIKYADKAEFAIESPMDYMLYAVWTKGTVAFCTNGGDEIEAIVAAAGTVITLPTPVREGYTFAGWKERKIIQYEYEPEYIEYETHTDTYTATNEQVVLNAAWKEEAFPEEFYIWDDGMVDAAESKWSDGYMRISPVIENGVIVVPQYRDNVPVTRICMHVYSSGAGSEISKTLAAVVFPESVTTMKGNMGHSATLKSIVLPLSLKSIEQGAFSGLNVSYIVYKGTTEQWNSIEKASGWAPSSSYVLVCLGDKDDSLCKSDDLHFSERGLLLSVCTVVSDEECALCGTMVTAEHRNSNGVLTASCLDTNTNRKCDVCSGIIAKTHGNSNGVLTSICTDTNTNRTCDECNEVILQAHFCLPDDDESFCLLCGIDINSLETHAHSITNMSTFLSIESSCSECEEVISATHLISYGENDIRPITSACTDNNPILNRFCGCCGNYVVKMHNFGSGTTCVYCGVSDICVDKLNTDVVYHVFDKKTTNHLASKETCRENRKYYLECSKCGAPSETLTYEVEKTAIGHDFTGEEIPAKAATCSAIGYSAHRICLNGCGAKDGYVEYAPKVNGYLNLSSYGQMTKSVDARVADGFNWGGTTWNTENYRYNTVGTHSGVVQTKNNGTTGANGVSGLTYVDMTRSQIVNKRPDEQYYGTGLEASTTEYSPSATVDYFVGYDDDYIYVTAREITMAGDDGYYYMRTNFSVKFGFNPNDYSQVLTHPVIRNEGDAWAIVNRDISLASETANDQVVRGSGKTYNAIKSDGLYPIADLMVAKFLYSSQAALISNLGSETGGYNFNINANSTQKWAVAYFSYKLSKADIAKVWDKTFGTEFEKNGLPNVMFLTAAGGSYICDSSGKQLDTSTVTCTLHNGTLLSVEQQTALENNCMVLPDVIVFGEVQGNGCEFTAHNTDSKYLVAGTTDTYYHTCDVCGAVGTTTFKVDGEVNVLYTNKSTEKQYEKVSPTCTTRGEYLYSCSCGEVDPNGANFEGDFLPHIPGPEPTECTDQVCIVCDCVLAESLGNGVHLYYEKRAALEATCEYGSRSALIGCQKCDYTEGDKLTSARLEHYFSSITGQCTVCGKTESKGLTFTSNGDGTCYVSGIGSCKDTDIIIPTKSPNGDTVTSIGDSAFSESNIDHNIITSVYIPAGVRSIGKCAFYCCKALTSASIPSSVEFIGTHAFARCRALTSIEIPKRVKIIEYCAFQECNSLTRVDLLASIETIETLTFSQCTVLERIDIPEGVKVIEDSAFSSCDTLTNIDIPGSVEYIGMSAFASCIGIKSISIPKGVTKIEEGAFMGCSALESITVHSGNVNYHSDRNCLIETSTKRIIAGCKNSVIPSDGSVLIIERYAFFGCSGLESIYVPETVTHIKMSAFSMCSGLTSINLPSTITIIESGTFYGCRSLSSIDIPTSVTHIGNEAFYGCSGLTSINISSNITEIGSAAFSGCGGLESITVNDGNIRYHSNGNCIIETDTKILVTGCKNSVIPSNRSVTSIGADAFKGCSTLISIEIPKNVITINYSAFYQCYGLESVKIPKSIERIESYAFADCISLKTIYYEGTKEQWNSVVKRYYWDNNPASSDSTGKYTVVFNS